MRSEGRTDWLVRPTWAEARGWRHPLRHWWTSHRCHDRRRDETGRWLVHGDKELQRQRSVLAELRTSGKELAHGAYGDNRLAPHKIRTCSYWPYVQIARRRVGLWPARQSCALNQKFTATLALAVRTGAAIFTKNKELRRWRCKNAKCEAFVGRISNPSERFGRGPDWKSVLRVPVSLPCGRC